MSNSYWEKCKKGDEKACQKHREISLRSYYKHRKERQVYAREYARKHQARHTETKKMRRHRIRNETIQLLGSKCVKCGFSDYRALQIDHVKGGGRKELRKYAHREAYSLALLKKIKAGSKEYQLLCANCNWIKRYENHE